MAPIGPTQWPSRPSCPHPHTRPRRAGTSLSPKEGGFDRFTVRARPPDHSGREALISEMREPRRPAASPFGTRSPARRGGPARLGLARRAGCGGGADLPRPRRRGADVRAPGADRTGAARLVNIPDPRHDGAGGRRHLGRRPQPDRVAQPASLLRPLRRRRHCLPRRLGTALHGLRPRAFPAYRPGRDHARRA